MADRYIGDNGAEVIIPLDREAVFSDPVLMDLADGPVKELMQRLAQEYYRGSYEEKQTYPMLIVKH